MDIQQRYTQASINTADNLKHIARSELVRDLSQLSLPEIDVVADLVGRIVPAGNVPGVILNGLARLPGRRPPANIVRRDVNLLFKGVEQALDKAVFGAFFAGPAAVIWGYQNLLKLAGKDPENAFPDGVWQFYTDYALREDTARHASENHGFDTLLQRHQIQLTTVDRITAWVMAAIHCLHQYDQLLENEWRERVHTHLLHQITCNEPDASRYARLYAEWSKRRPYGRGSDSAPTDTYPAYRRFKFDQFMQQATHNLRGDLHQAWQQQARQAERHDLPAYQQQMSILAYLDPGPYGETHTPIPLEEAQIGIVWQGCYYLIPAGKAGRRHPAEVSAVRQQIASLVGQPSSYPPAGLTSLATVRRKTLPKLRTQFRPVLVQSIGKLRFAPILLNHDLRPRHLPLAELRQAERGCGDHALTIFDTGESQVFDQSHIFFDGTWGAALAEILTNEALAWAVYLSQLPPACVSEERPVALDLRMTSAEAELVQYSPRITAETGAEALGIDLKTILSLRKLFKQRNDLLRLTVNDLLVLFRAIHAFTYQPNPDLVAQLRVLTKQPEIRPAALAALEAIDRSGQANPAILIPVDASPHSPRDRLHPLTVDVPLAELNLLELHHRTLAALEGYQSQVGDRGASYTEFDQLQRNYLSTLAGFGEVMSKAKEIAVAGKSASVGALKLLAHIPAPLQRLLDQVPSRFEILNDLIKGQEVFSNVGAVAESSSLVRFITAKDDNEKKTLAWGVITDADGVMHLSLRDFRPHVELLNAVGCREIAQRLAQDYLDAYVLGLNQYIRDLRQITLTSRETRLLKE